MPLSPDFSNKEILEKYSAAFTLSDMELFVFPDLFYPLVLSNIMSPVIWGWKEDPWFEGIAKKSFNFKVNRIKQYIMDHYVFNLDLETWGLTDKATELARFSGVLDEETLKKSNALFGYEGDKYYFDIDIRRHFGLDKYNSDIIPYWKTETVEAMTSFRFKSPANQGAGECVSFSALYAAALFVVGGVPLDQIYLMGTPLHSQNYIDAGEGVLTNNRRIVTKKMWFNGTAISSRARRALENERVTIISHISGHIHYLYPEATIHKASYQLFADKLARFLTTRLTAELFINFLRYHMKFKKCFQFRHARNGRNYYLPLETVFEYEHSTRLVFSEANSEALLEEVDDEEFSLNPIDGLLLLQDVTDYLKLQENVCCSELLAFCSSLAGHCDSVTADHLNQLFEALDRFLTVVPRLPQNDKIFIEKNQLDIRTGQSREEIISMIRKESAENEMALLSLYAYRDLSMTDWRPFLKAALLRNPVSLEALKDYSPEEVYRLLVEMPGDSIYDGSRLAQPDEVWNFGRGDGLEKAILMANYLYNHAKSNHLMLRVENGDIILDTSGLEFRFGSTKNILQATINLLAFLSV